MTAEAIRLVEHGTVSQGNFLLPMDLHVSLFSRCLRHASPSLAVPCVPPIPIAFGARPRVAYPVSLIQQTSLVVHILLMARVLSPAPVTEVHAHLTAAGMAIAQTV
mmetsp:Transcript_5246/g.16959  ORF Transcript_5246/g.16959 Transcript_5246/m.16959 type:complete len:106 (-) Transcript_5246:438-755(-)